MSCPRTQHSDTTAMYNVHVPSVFKKTFNCFALLQESFVHCLYSESSDDDDSGVEEPNLLHPSGRRRSVVSFNLSPSPNDAQSTDGEADSENEGHFYLPTNVRSIEETFDAWQDSFKPHSESRTSMFSSGGSSPYPHSPQIREEDELLETQSSSSCYSAQESDATVTNNNIRPASRLSFVSDNSEKTLSPEPRSRVSSASSVSLVLETSSQTGSLQEGSNVGDKDSRDPRGADDMTRSLSSVLSFNTEHGQVKGNSPPLERFVDEPALAADLISREDMEGDGPYTSKEEPVVESEGTVEQEDLISREEVEGNSTNTSKKKSMLESEPVVTSSIIIETTSIEGTVSELNMIKSDTGRSEEEIPPVNEIRVNITDKDTKELPAEGNVPSINVEMMCTGDEEVLVKGISLTVTSADSNSVAEAVNEETSESVPIDGLNKELSETTEDLFNADESLSLSDAVVDYSGSIEVSRGEERQELEVQTSQKDDVKPIGSDEEDCLHCKKFSKRKDAIPATKAAVDNSPKEYNSLNDEDSKQSKSLDLNSDTGETASVDEYSVQKSTENESIAEEQASLGKSTLRELDLDSDIRNERSTFEIREDNDDDEQETAEKENESEALDSQDKEPDEDDEGGYTTEASATTLQGIRGVFGKRRRCSTAATSVAFDVADESAFSEDGSEMEEKPFDLATKEGLDGFKEFLLETSGEKLLQFWLEVECGKYLEHDDEKSRYCF